jgi:hypothetical protein
VGTEPGQDVLRRVAANSSIATRFLAPVTTAEYATSSATRKG